MATVQQLKKKLQTIRSTAKVTGAMKTASTVKYSRISGIYSEYQKYAGEHLHLYEAYKSEFNSVIKRSNPDAPCCYVVITSNKEMCGGFNNEVLSFFSTIEDNEGVIISCGKRGTDYFLNKQIKTVRDFIFDDIPTYEQTAKLFYFVCSLLEEGKVSEVKTVYPEYINMMKQTPVCKDLFSYEEEDEKKNESPLFVPDRETVIKNTAEKIFLSVLYKRVLETALGAQAATLTAMRSAYDTACEYSANLETEMNRKRQSQVTADVLETASEFSTEGDK